MDKSSRIYVAGHTGLIGSALVRRLEREGCQNLLLMPRAGLDLTDASAVDQFFNQHLPEYVLLAAGRVGGIVENQTYPADFMNANLAIQLNVLKAAHRAGVRKLILFASSCMYPRECAQPMSESALLSGNPEPTSLAYAVSKLAGMQMCLAYNRQYGSTRFLPVIPNSAFGPNDNFDLASGHVLSALIRRFHEARAAGQASITLWGSGTPRREFVHADDIASACAHLLRTDVSQVDFPLNIGSGTDMSIRELAGKIAAIAGFNGTIEWNAARPDGAPQKLLDSSKLRNLGWKPEVDFDIGLRTTFDWYLNHCNGAGAATPGA